MSGPQSVVVPVEPTPKMMAATWDHEIDKSGGIESQNTRNARIWSAMLAAAPAPSSLAGGEDDFAHDLARTLDRYGLKDAGWSDADIADALEMVGEPSGVSQATVKAIMPMIEARLAALSPEAPAREGDVAWACTACNSPRAVDPCPKCGTELTKPADGWDWPRLPDIERIRELAREVGYAVGVHGTLERDLDLIAAPWIAEAVKPFELAQHIASGIGGNVLDYKTQDKPCGRWSCNINSDGWFKLIDLSVMTPALTPRHEAPASHSFEASHSVHREGGCKVCGHDEASHEAPAEGAGSFAGSLAVALEDLSNAAEVVRRMLHNSKDHQGRAYNEAGIPFVTAINRAKMVLKDYDRARSSAPEARS